MTAQALKVCVPQHNTPWYTVRLTCCINVTAGNRAIINQTDKPCNSAHTGLSYICLVINDICAFVSSGGTTPVQPMLFAFYAQQTLKQCCIMSVHGKLGGLKAVAMPCAGRNRKLIPVPKANRIFE